MAIRISDKHNFSGDEKTLKKENISIQKIWMIDPNSFRNKIKIRNVYNPLDILVESTAIENISVNGETFDSLEKLSEVLNPLLFKSGGADEGEGGSDLQTITTNGNTTDKDLITNEAAIGRVSATENLKFGKNTLRYVTTGTKNVAIGDYSQYINEVAAENTSVGYSALRNLKTGNWNTVVGTNSAYSLIDGINTTVIGTYSLVNTKASEREVVIGSSSMVNYTGGSYTSLSYPNITRKSSRNVVIGDSSMYQLINGYGNVAIGSKAGYNFKNYGDGNILIGMNTAGLTASTNGDLNVIIGTNAPVNGSGNGRLIIHSQFTPAEGGNGTYQSIPLVEGSFEKQWFKIGGNLKLYYAYTPDVKDGFIATKMLVLDKDGNTGVQDLPTSIGSGFYTHDFDIEPCSDELNELYPDSKPGTQVYSSRFRLMFTKITNTDWKKYSLQDTVECVLCAAPPSAIVSSTGNRSFKLTWERAKGAESYHIVIKDMHTNTDFLVTDIPEADREKGLEVEVPNDNSYEIRIISSCDETMFIKKYWNLT